MRDEAELFLLFCFCFFSGWSWGSGCIVLRIGGSEVWLQLAWRFRKVGGI